MFWVPGAADTGVNILVKVTVLGRYGPFPAAGGACSGYLINASGSYVLLDCGAGVLSRLAVYIAPESLSALILSHLHSDHISDVSVLRYALDLASERRDDALPVWVPLEPKDQLGQLLYRDHLVLHEPLCGQAVKIGALKATPVAVKHSIPTFGWRISDGAKTLAYSADSENCESLVELAREADLFLCEATYIDERLRQGEEPSVRPSGRTDCCRAGVKRLLLTHLCPLEDPDLLLAEAQKVFPAAELAVERRTYEV